VHSPYNLSEWTMRFRELSSSTGSGGIVRSAESSQRTHPNGLAGSVPAEHVSLTSRVGLFDRSHLSKVKLVGRDSIDLLQRLSTNDLSDLRNGISTLTVLVTEKGRVIDLVNLVPLPDKSLVLICSAPAAEVMNWIGRFIILEDVTLEDMSDDYALFSLIGPKAGDVLDPRRNQSAVVPESGSVQELTIQGARVIVFGSEPIGTGGLNLIVPASDARRVWEELLLAGTPDGLRPCTLQALDVLRVESGFPSFGKELTSEVNPLEAGLSRYVSFTKGCYIGQEVIARLDTYRKLQKRLMGLVIKGHGDGLEGAEVSVEGREVGFVTSAANSPKFGGQIALAYIRSQWAHEMTRVSITPKAQPSVDAIVVELPFTKLKDE
jgi:folate-binding protein YgfZ